MKWIKKIVEVADYTVTCQWNDDVVRKIDLTDFVRQKAQNPKNSYAQLEDNWNLITRDTSDNKFVDGAIAGNADYIITYDGHFNVLENIGFPKVNIATIPEFSAIFERKTP